MASSITPRMPWSGTYFESSSSERPRALAYAHAYARWPGTFPDRGLGSFLCSCQGRSAPTTHRDRPEEICGEIVFVNRLGEKLRILLCSPSMPNPSDLVILPDDPYYPVPWVPSDMGDMGPPSGLHIGRFPVGKFIHICIYREIQ